MAGRRRSAEEHTDWVGRIAVERHTALAPGKAQVQVREHRREARCRARSLRRLAGVARAVHTVGDSTLAVALHRYYQS